MSLIGNNYIITPQQLRKIVEESYAEGEYSASRGCMVGNSDWECRSYLCSEDTLKLVKDKLKKDKPIRFPERVKTL